MPTLPTAVRNAACNAIVDLLDAGSGAGYISFLTSGDVEVARVTLSDPAFGDAAVGVATANAITSDTDADGGLIAKAKAFDSDDTEVAEFTCGTSGTDFIFSSTESMTLGAGDTFGVSALTCTMPAAPA